MEPPWLVRDLFRGPIYIAEGIVLTCTLGFYRPMWTTRFLMSCLLKRCKIAERNND